MMRVHTHLLSRGWVRARGPGTRYDTTVYLCSRRPALRRRRHPTHSSQRHVPHSHSTHGANAEGGRGGGSHMVCWNFSCRYPASTMRMTMCSHWPTLRCLPRPSPVAPDLAPAHVRAGARVCVTRWCKHCRTHLGQHTPRTDAHVPPPLCHKLPHRPRLVRLRLHTALHHAAAVHTHMTHTSPQRRGGGDKLARYAPN